MALDAQLQQRLQQDRLPASVADQLLDLGVVTLDDLRFVGVDDFDLAGLKVVERRKFEALLESVKQPAAHVVPVEPAPILEPAGAITPVLPAVPAWPLVHGEGQRQASSEGTAEALAGAQRAGGSARPNFAPPGRSRAGYMDCALLARRPESMNVPRLKLKLTAERKSASAHQRDEEDQRDEEVCEREAHRLAGPAWHWVRVEFPVDKDELNICVDDVVREGLQWQGRRYVLVSTSKGNQKHGATAWLASIDGHGDPQECLERTFWWDDSLRLQAPTEKRPHPDFLLRSRVKQLFSSLMVIIDTWNLELEVKDNRGDRDKIRDDGAGEVDPDILDALWRCYRGWPGILEHEEDDDDLLEVPMGLRRHVPGSAQCRSFGLKGMLLSSERLRGQRIVEVPKSMLKFHARHHRDQLGRELGVICFSVVRPASLGTHLLLMLEGRGVPESVILKALHRYLRKITGPLAHKLALRMLRADGCGCQAESNQYLSTMARLLGAGFNMSQHPLLQVIRKQQTHALERARRSLPLSGCWSLRGHPEPRPEGRDHILDGLQVFCMLPSTEDNDDDVPGWRVVTGPVLVAFNTDRDPGAIRVCEAIDSEVLRHRCQRGILYFSVRGEDIAEGLSWDFDGDYFVLIENRDVTQAVSRSPATRPRNNKASSSNSREDSCPTRGLSELQGHFLKTFPQFDKAGLWHYTWEMHAGEKAGAVNEDHVRRDAAEYAASLDVEKGGPRPAPPRFGGSKVKWDFMKRPDNVECRESPTLAGLAFRAAQTELENFQTCCNTVSDGVDPDLDEAWERLERQMKREARESLMKLAEEVRTKFRKRVEADTDQRQSGSPDTNFSSPSHHDEADALFAQFVKKQWDAPLHRFLFIVDCQPLQRIVCGHMDLLSDGCRPLVHRIVENICEVVSMGKLPPEAADDPVRWVTKGNNAAADHLCNRTMDVVKSAWSADFPWVLFVDEYTSIKQAAKPCSHCAREALRRRVLTLRRAAKLAVQDPPPERAKASMKAALDKIHPPSCTLCARDMQHYEKQRLEDASPQELLDTFEAYAKGEVKRVPVSHLFYCKDVIGRTFRHGKQENEPLEMLVQRIVSAHGSSAGSPLRGLELTAVSFHGRLHVVEGNRRLWCVKEASARLGEDLEVKVKKVDLCLGCVYQQSRRLPALHAFWYKHTTTNHGESVEWESEELASTDAQGGGRGLAGSQKQDVDAEPDFRSVFLACDTEQQVKDEFRKLSMIYHPDKGGRTKAFQELQQAYEEAVRQRNTNGQRQEQRPQSRRKVITAKLPQNCMHPGCKQKIEVGHRIFNHKGWCHEWHL